MKSYKKIGIWGMGREGQAVRQALECHVINPDITEITEENVSDICHMIHPVCYPFLTIQLSC